MIEVIPAILETTKEGFESKFKLLEPYADRIHLDISDGLLTSTKTIKGYEELIGMPNSKKWDIHLMINFPENVMESWYKTGANTFIFHREIGSTLRGLIESARINGKRVGIAINPETPIEDLFEFLEFIDFVHFMTVNPGAQGSFFHDDVINKMAMFHQQYPEVKISVDGHVDPQTGPRLVIAGASELVVGSYIFNSPDIAAAFESLKPLKNFGG